jgi:type II secretory pathway component PulJ
MRANAGVLALSAAVSAVAIGGTISVNTLADRVLKAESRLAVVQGHVLTLEADILKLRARIEKTEVDDLLAFQVISSHGRRLRRFERAIPIEVR